MPPVPGGEAGGSTPAATGEGAAAGLTPTPPKAKGDTNEIANLTITFRAVSLKGISSQADADKGIAYTVLEGMKSSPFFDPDPQATHTTSEVSYDEQGNTFTFSIVAKLAHPLKL